MDAHTLERVLEKLNYSLKYEFLIELGQPLICEVPEVIGLLDYIDKEKVKKFLAFFVLSRILIINQILRKSVSILARFSLNLEFVLNIPISLFTWKKKKLNSLSALLILEIFTAFFSIFNGITDANTKWH